jgi:adenine-specific DNA methylase
MTRKPAVLIESWLPIEAIGAECKRERGTSSALPPLYFLNVWWARRSLIASRAAILAGVLPAWSPNFPNGLRERFPNEQSYHQWSVNFIGIRGDPVKGMKLIQWAKAKGVKLDFSPYDGAPRAFTVNPSGNDLEIMGDLLEFAWGTRDLSTLDPFSGGGSIPFDALRYGFSTYANDINPVASVILKATLDYPARFGVALTDEIRKWGDRWNKKVKEKLESYYPKQLNENIFAYLWARTIQWHDKTIPLSPNWWLKTNDPPIAMRVIADENSNVPHFEILHGAKAKASNPDIGTISRGAARSPWTGETIDGDTIKQETRAGRMGQILYSIAMKKVSGFEFRTPTPEDIIAVGKAKDALSKIKPEWIAKNVIPTEAFPEGNDNRPLFYGMLTWADFFAPRQLFVQ